MSRKKIQKGSFAQRLVAIRKGKGLTQAEVSRLTGISTRMICHYETRIRNPATDTVLRLTKALDVSVDQLMGYKNYKEKKEDIFSRKTFRRAKLLDKLPEKDKKTVYSLIDALASKGNHVKKD